MHRGSSGFLFLVVLCCGGRAFPQWAQMPTTGVQPQTLTDRTIIAGQSGLGSLMTAEFIDKKHNASERRAIIDVHTDGVQIIDPAKVGNAPALSQAHVQYKVDGGTLVKTTSRRIEIDNLSPGEHQIQVALASNDNKPLGHETTLNLHIPGSQ